MSENPMPGKHSCIILVLVQHPGKHLLCQTAVVSLKYKKWKCLKAQRISTVGQSNTVNFKSCSVSSQRENL